MPDSSLPPSSQKPSAARLQGGQFSLRWLFWMTSIVAGWSAIGTVLGPGALPFAVGMTVAFASMCGGLKMLSVTPIRPRMFYAAWLILAASLLMPSVRGCNGKAIAGWQAAQVCAGAGLAVVTGIAERTEADEGPIQPREWLTLVNLALLNAANLALIASPLLLWRLQRDRGQLLAGWLAITAVPVWLLAVLDADDYLLGYYMWSSCFIVLVATSRVRIIVFVVMSLLAVIILGLSLSIG